MQSQRSGWRERLAEGAHDLQVARHIQHSLLPSSFPQLRSFGLSGFCLGARQVAGDFYDVVSLTPDSVLLVVADVMGKGIPAALFAASLRTLVRSMVEWTQDPAELLSRANRLIYAELSRVDMFITAQVVRVDTRSRELQVASAGHCPLLIASRGNARCLTIPAQGMPIGIVPDLELSRETVALVPGTCVLMYTDGVPETCNSRAEFFGQQRLEEWLCAAANGSKSSAELREDFLGDLKNFQGQLQPYDDQTFLLLAEERAFAGANGY